MSERDLSVRCNFGENDGKRLVSGRVGLFIFTHRYLLLNLFRILHRLGLLDRTEPLLGIQSELNFLPSARRLDLALLTLGEVEGVGRLF